MGKPSWYDKMFGMEEPASADPNAWVPNIGPDGLQTKTKQGLPAYRPRQRGPSDLSDLAIPGDPMQNGNDENGPWMRSIANTMTNPEVQARLKNQRQSENLIDATALGELLKPVLVPEDAASRIGDWGRLAGDISKIRPAYVLNRMDMNLPRRDPNAPDDQLNRPENVAGSFQGLVVPGVARDGRLLQNELEAEAEFRRTGEHYGSYHIDQARNVADQIRMILEQSYNNYAQGYTKRTEGGGIDEARKHLGDIVGVGPMRQMNRY